jgi:hypothetical protein
LLDEDKGVVIPPQPLGRRKLLQETVNVPIVMEIVTVRISKNVNNVKRWMIVVVQIQMG